MLTQESNSQKKIKIRVIIMLLSILLSKNVEIVIIRPNLTFRIKIESIYTKSVVELLKLF
jgi:hypothetical protein